MTTEQPRANAPPKATARLAIDRDQLRTMLRQLRSDEVYSMLDEALDLLPDRKLVKLTSRYLDVKRLQPDAPSTARTHSLLSDVKEFDARSRAGKYYESFNVNSQNYTQKSRGTQAFIADCKRLFDRCVANTPKGDPAETRASFETLFDLLRRIDECRDDVVFFADEAGAWQVDVDWDKVLPGWFRCVSRTTDSQEFARLIVGVVDEFDRAGRAQHFTKAGKSGTAAQRRALAKTVEAQQERQG